MGRLAMRSGCLPVHTVPLAAPVGVRAQPAAGKRTVDRHAADAAGRHAQQGCGSGGPSPDTSVPSPSNKLDAELVADFAAGGLLVGKERVRSETPTAYGESH
jgi:hypothetical protein